MILIVLGLNLAGVLPHRRARADVAAARAGATASLATATGTVGARLARLGRRRPGHRRSARRPASSARSGGWLASFGLGAIFAIGWTPCIGIILGGILTMAATSGTVAQGAILLIAYTLGPRPAVHRHRRRLRPGAGGHSRRSSGTAASCRSSAACSWRAIGVAMVFDWLALAAALLPVRHGDLR